MASGNDIIKNLISTIDGSINSFNSAIPKVQRDILAEVELLVKKLDLKSDSIQASSKNLRIIGELKSKINKILRAPEYKGLVKEFAKSFGKISELQNDYFRTLEKQYKPPKLLGELQSQSVDATIRSLVEGGVEVNIGSKIVEILRQNITGGAKYTDMVERLREYLTTTKAGDGALERYAKQITTDALNQYSRQYLQVVSSDLGFKWYRYTGAIIETSRPFCKACVDKQYLFEAEFPDLLKGKFPEFKANDGVINSNTKLPSGMIAGTNPENFLVYAGGWQCNHQPVPVSEDRVPINIRIAAYQKYSIPYDAEGFAIAA